MKIRHWIPLVGLGVALALGFGAVSQQGGGGRPGGSTFSTQYKINSTTFGGSGPGSMGEVLTSNGAGMAPTFQAGSSVTPAALTKTDDTNVTLTLGGTPTTALLQATSITAGWTGQLGVSRGGTNLSASADDNVMVGNATTWETKAVPNCTDTVGQHLNYTTSTNAFSCGTTNSGGFSPVYKFKSTFTQRTSATATADPDLIATSVPAGSYEFDAFFIEGPGAGSFRMQWTITNLTGGTSAYAACQGLTTAGSSSPLNGYGINTNVTNSVTSNDVAFICHGGFVTSSAFTFSLDWGLQSASGTTTMRDSSWIKLQRIL